MRDQRIPTVAYSFLGLDALTSRWLESKVQEVQCSTCGSVSKAKLKEQSVVISPHPPRKVRAVRNVTRWTHAMRNERGWQIKQLASRAHVLSCIIVLRLFRDTYHVQPDTTWDHFYARIEQPDALPPLLVPFLSQMWPIGSLFFYRQQRPRTE